MDFPITLPHIYITITITCINSRLIPVYLRTPIHQFQVVKMKLSNEKRKMRQTHKQKDRIEVSVFNSYPAPFQFLSVMQVDVFTRRMMSFYGSQSRDGIPRTPYLK